MAEVVNNGFYMKLFRVGANAQTPKGGIGIYVKSPRLEELTSSNSSGMGEHEMYSARFYRLGTGLVFPRYSLPILTDWGFNERLIDNVNGILFLFPLLMVGVTEGSVCMVPGIHPRQQLEEYGRMMKRAVQSLWQEYMKPITLELTSNGEDALDVAS